MAGEMWVMERAKEEINWLEAQYPARFDYLKLELQTLISDYVDLDPSSPAPTSSYSPPSTQASSNRGKRGLEICDGDLLGFGFEKRRRRRMKRSMDDGAEMAIERAMDCLRRIRRIKDSFLR